MARQVYLMLLLVIYLPEEEIEAYGGVEKLGKKEDFENIKKRLLSKDLVFESPV